MGLTCACGHSGKIRRRKPETPRAPPHSPLRRWLGIPRGRLKIESKPLVFKYLIICCRVGKASRFFLISPFPYGSLASHSSQSGRQAFRDREAPHPSLQGQGPATTDLPGGEVFEAFRFNKHLKRELTVLLPLRFISEIKIFGYQMAEWETDFYVNALHT